MRQSIRGYTDGIIEEAAATGEIRRTADELRAVWDLLWSSDDLRRTLADPGVSASSRRAVVSELLSDRVGSFTLRLIQFVIEADRATEVVADIDWLTTRLNAAADHLEPVGEVVLGHKAAEERLDGYSTALLQVLPSDGGLTQIEEELFRFMQVLDATEELRTVLSSRDVPAAARKRLVGDLLSAKATPTTQRLASYATQVGRPRDYEDLLAFLVDRLSKESHKRMAEVRSAIELDEDRQQELSNALRRVVGYDVQLRVSVDPSILGGFVATIGDTVVDASVRHQLEVLRDRLVMPEANITLGGSS
ncbi:MAG TPA: ATP synthase F1 subunit delta [Acidimicrobiales bacterium]|nr:ATP synthase F1 subunit delta [Acidimicrobiales bacterium]